MPVTHPFLLPRNEFNGNSLSLVADPLFRTVAVMSSEQTTLRMRNCGNAFPIA